MDQNLIWNWKGLRAAVAFVVVLLATFFFPPTRYLWNIVDQQFFLLINSWIATNSLVQNIVAILNYKRFDWVHDIVFLIFFIVYVKNAPRERRLYRMAQILFAILLAAFVITYINKNLLTGLLRDSPSLHFPNCTRLSKKVTWLFVKDYSRCSFPADHGTTACLFIGVTHILMGARAGLFATLYAFFFVAPRLIVGAHWLSDILVGSATIAILTLAIGYCTPLAELFAQTIAKKKTSRRRSLDFD